MGYFVGCKDCSNRKVGCHSHCEVYIKDKEEHDKEQDDIRKERAINQYVRDRLVMYRPIKSKFGKFGESKYNKEYKRYARSKSGMRGVKYE